MAANDEGVGGIQGNKILEAPNSCQKNQPWRKWVPKDTDKDPSKPWVGYQPDPKNESAKPWVDWIESMGPTASFLDGAMSGNAGG
ncbi:hypothetical protein QBC47DRAFT_380284 [Echria macrotheca]|uniref:Uncharacterized protein n=1 Tax=Echria macrotheca TaxID=438768 RepID=A0AAJ0FCL7_9PEZI|nr:hypothetical protein QBC47DRAFT_380284 [Echria macrotheca]